MASRKPRPLRTFEFPVEVNGQIIGIICYNREDGYSVKDAAIWCDSKEEAETIIIERARRQRAA
jgi:hypothetical protein